MAAFLETEIKHKGLDPDAGAREWQLHWFGSTSLNRNTPSQDVVEVVLRALDGKPPEYVFSSVGTGGLCGLWLGSVWQGGERLDDPVMATFNGKIDFTSPALTTAYSELPESKPGSVRYLIPNFAYPLPSRMSSSPCYVFDANAGTTKIIVPATEVARAFYLRGTLSTHALLCGSYDDAIAQMIDVEATLRSEAEGAPHIYLRYGMNDGEAAIAIMLWKNKLAHTNIASMIGQMRALAANKKALHLQALPPVTGLQHIEARGRRWRSKDKSTEFFLALRLVEVPYPDLGSDRIDFSIDRLEEDEVDDGSASQGAPAWKPRTPHRPSRAELTSTKEPNTNIPPKHLDSGVPVWHSIPKLVRHERTIKWNRSKSPVQEFDADNDGDHSTAQGTTDGGVTPAKFIDRTVRATLAVDPCMQRIERPSLPATFQTLIATAELLNKVTGVTTAFKSPSTNALDVDGHPTWSFSETEAQKSWPYVDQRFRQAMILEIRKGQHFFYAVEIERRGDTDRYATGIVYSKAQMSQFASLLNTITDQEGHRLHELSGFACCRVMHRHKTNEDFANRILEACNDLTPPARMASPIANVA